MSMADDLKTIAERDGLTIDQARVLIEMWAYPIGLALKSAHEKAQSNHPHWQAWCAAQRATVPSLTEWQTRTAEKA
jgi:hypothetical protein